VEHIVKHFEAHPRDAIRTATANRRAINPT
jgi:hypothetical protein